jgi:hypothetical protein
MAKRTKPNEKLASSMRALRDIVQAEHRRVIQADELSRTDRDRLVKGGYLKPIINGWLMTANPKEKSGDSTTWYTSYWEFIRDYANNRFDNNWILSPEASISLLAGERSVPNQIIIQCPKANNLPIELPNKTSIFFYKTDLPKAKAADVDGLRVYPLPQALISASPQIWKSKRDEIIALLGSVRTISVLLGPLLENGNVAAAGRISGALRLLGHEKDAEAINSALKRAGHVPRETKDPFQAPIPMVAMGTKGASPVGSRIKIIWEQMRAGVLSEFVDIPKIINDHDGYLENIDERYTSDAYHSLSIEGYQVSEELIEKVRNSGWDPDHDKDDQEHMNALAAKGYWMAFQKVRSAIERILNGKNAAVLIEEEHQEWGQELFQPSVDAGIIGPERLAGYRSHPVFLRTSMYVPTAWQSLPDAMDAYFSCLKEEKDPRVAAVLGHFVFTYIHPFADGNGRTGRFIMNAMLASGGYLWTIVPVERRSEYLAAMDAASLEKNIKPLARLIQELVRLAPPPPRRRSKAEVNADKDNN